MYQGTIIAQEKLASLGMLSAGIAHKIKNPLNIILNAAEALKMSIPEELSPECKHLSEIISSSALRADGIINAMLSQARSTTSERSEHDISQICEQAVELSRHSKKISSSDCEIQFEVNIEPNIRLKCHAEDIQRVLINLIDNSVDALIEKMDQISDCEGQINIDLGDDEDNVYLKVQDNGIGILKEQLDKVREPFFTTKPTGKGTGLGMSMINDIINAQGREILIESVYGNYTECFVILPKNLNSKKAA